MASFRIDDPQLYWALERSTLSYTAQLILWDGSGRGVNWFDAANKIVFPDHGRYPAVDYDHVDAFVLHDVTFEHGVSGLPLTDAEGIALASRYVTDPIDFGDIKNGWRSVQVHVCRELSCTYQALFLTSEGDRYLITLAHMFLGTSARDVPDAPTLTTADLRAEDSRIEVSVPRDAFQAAYERAFDQPLALEEFESLATDEAEGPATDEARFLAAILDRPEDSISRLVFADWLDERGGTGDAARAEFLRTQVRLAELDAHDPDRVRAEGRLLELVAANGREWTRPLWSQWDERKLWDDHLPPWDSPGGWTGDPRGWFAAGKFRDGFVRWEWDYGMVLASRKRIRELAWLGRIGLRNYSDMGRFENRVRTLAGDAVLRLVTRVSTDVWWHAERLEILARSPHLVSAVEWVSSSGGSGDGDEDAVALALAGNPALGALRTISWRCSRLSARGITALATSRALAALTDLTLEHHRLGGLQMPGADEAQETWRRYRRGELRFS